MTKLFAAGSRGTAAVIVALAAVVNAPGALAQAQPKPQEYTPSVGQSGKDVVWVPTPEALVERMLAMAKVTSDDYVVDLGSGDGRTVIAAARKGARSMGVEFNPDMVDLSNRALAREDAAVQKRAKFVRGDIFETDFTSATVVTMYLLPQLNIRLRPKILDMKPGTRVVSHAFSMEDWQPDETATVEGRDAFLWIVPAKVAGTWRLATPAGSGVDEVDMALIQKFQKLDGTVSKTGLKSVVTGATLRGDRIGFTFVDGNGAKREYTGQVSGDRMEGTTTLPSGAPVRWTATRKAG